MGILDQLESGSRANLLQHLQLAAFKNQSLLPESKSAFLLLLFSAFTSFILHLSFPSMRLSGILYNGAALP